MKREVPRWGIFEAELPGPGEDVVFTHDGRHFTAAPYADESGRYRVRFLPDAEGEWQYTTVNGPATFGCGPAAGGHHGPVRAQGRGFLYADGEPFHPFGTTLTGVEEHTLRTLATAPFNRVRLRAPADLPLPVLDQQVLALGKLGIQAEVPLHGRDIPATVSCLAAHHNVWWCVPDDPDLHATVLEHDYGHHLLTVHGDARTTSFGAPWITHASVRLDQVRDVASLVAELDKPVVVDDCGAEGDAPQEPASLSAEEMVARIWEGLCLGGYVTHAEEYGTRTWSSGGGALRGEAASRLDFLRALLADAPFPLVHNPAYYDASTVEVPGEFLLQYLGPHRYPSRRFDLAEGAWSVEVIDAWNMKRAAPYGVSGGRVEVSLPAEPYIAIRIRRASSA
ncbi:DUF5605 domain-containing protein [Streptomyces pseudoechinosporeus]